MNIFKYVMIVTEEYEDELNYYADNPWQGKLVDIVFGQNVDTLIKPEDEGLFYQLYALDSGDRIGYGALDWGVIEEEIEAYEDKKRTGMADV